MSQQNKSLKIAMKITLCKQTKTKRNSLEQNRKTKLSC